MSIDKHTSNINLIYEYAENALKNIRDSSNILNTKLGTVIGFDAVLIRFSSSLPDKSFIIDFPNTDISLSCKLCLLLKIFSYLALIISLVFGLWGFKPQKGGEIILPEKLIEKCIDISEEHYRRSIIENWNKSIVEQATLDWLETLNYTPLNAFEIAPYSPNSYQAKSESKKPRK
ncbi:MULTISPECIES: hypothetical protein [unclassified Coleofasciculus]|uniref:hypothetical protein n=1 Tax=unclassified Coleofasciculus TaxID=2692782 RepID=UPI00187F6746|nr:MULTISPECIES: hypothetical protein [unclassified Coleofasciculus]MBE9126044.1 hypothetical protein [Coleofasciculus sp. LEGE 07081]MBE9148732.1 hypothetical protein [Coleofasciculus sp. LEGE 07092]